MIQRDPVMISFLCHWCAYDAADAAGRAHKEVPAGFRPVRVPCSGRVDPEFVFEALRKGADGVLILGCRLGDCHFRNGNHQALKRHLLMKRMLAQFGISPDRVHLDFVSAGEGDRLVDLVWAMHQRLRRLGKSGMAGDLAEA